MSEPDDRIVAKRFELRRVAGRGGMAIVHEALDRETDTTVALKIVEGEFANARFEREARVLAQLEHPGIVRYIAHGSIDDGRRMYLAMEWLEGTPLDVKLEGGALSLEESCVLGSRLARALHAAHAMGIVHRDVKPSNVVLRAGKAEDAVLVDFGIARGGDVHAMTMTGAVVGTPSYMAPEQVRGEKEVDPRADIFSLGCVLFECLAGHTAFAGEHIVAVLAKILLEQAPRVRSFRTEVPRSLDELVASMMEKEQDGRPPNGAQVAERLESLGTASSGGVSILAPPTGIGAIEQRFATVLIARLPAPAKTDAFADTIGGRTGEDALVEAATKLGVRVHRLADGALVGVLTADQSGTNMAMRVVSCAVTLASENAEYEQARIAVATGRAVVAGDLPVGAAIDAAARILSTTQSTGAGVWCCDRTAILVEPEFDLEPRRDASARVIGQRAKDRDRTRTLLGRTTPFVGRDRDLALLEATFVECADEPVARSMLLVAPPGIGKSRLQRELVQRVATREKTAIWLGLADPLMQDAPFALAGDLLRRVFRIVEGEPLERRREKILTHVSASVHDAHADPVARRLGEISGTPFDDVNDDALRAARRDPPLLAAQVQEAFITFVCAELARGPRLVIIEDIHWADVASVRLFGAALAVAKDLPLMALALARPTIDEVHPKLWSEHHCQRIDLAPLLKKAAAQLARAVLGENADVDAIVRRADGNALFVEELARALSEGRAADDLPPTVAAVTEARLAALPPDVRRTLRAAAIFGERFWASGVVAVVGENGTGERSSDESLRLLEDAEIVSIEPKSRFGGEREYAFRHALVQDAAYAMLTDGDRKIGHALAAGWLESRIDDGALLAHHYEMGGRNPEAARSHVRAAEQALAAHDFAALSRHARKAESLGAEPAALGRVHLAEADAWLWLGENEKASTSSRAAVRSLERGSEKWFLAIGIGVAATGKLSIREHFDALVAELESVPATDERAGRARAIARARASMQLAWFGEGARADALLEGIEKEPGAVGDRGVGAWRIATECERGLASGELEHPSKAREGRAICLALGDRRAAFSMWAAELQTLSRIGAFQAAIDVTVEFSKEAGETPAMDVYLTLMRGSLAMWNGDFSGVPALAQFFLRRGNPRFTSDVMSGIAQCLLIHGQRETAVEYARQAYELPGAPKHCQSMAESVLARAAVIAGEVDEALARSEHALLLGREQMPTSGCASLHLARFEALQAAGRIDEARAALRFGIDAIAHLTRHLREYRAILFESAEYPLLLKAAREQDIPVPNVEIHPT